MAEVVKIVDPGEGAGHDYHSLSLWEAGEQGDLTSGARDGEIAVATCRATGGTADTTACTINGFTTSATEYIKIWTDPAETYRHAGVWSTSKYRLEVANATAITISDQNVWIDGLQIHVTESNANYQAGIKTSSIVTGNDIRISSCLIKFPAGGTNRDQGINLSDGDTNLLVWNCLVYGGAATPATPYNAAIISDGATCLVLNCTLVGGYYGLARGVGTVTAKNVYAHAVAASGDGACYYGTITKTNCASSDDTADGTAPQTNTPYSTDTFLSVTPATDGTGDYLKPNNTGELYGTGATLTDDPPGSTALGVDIAGNARS